MGDQALTVHPLRIWHNDEIIALENSMKYIEQKEEAEGIDIMMLER